VKVQAEKRANNPREFLTSLGKKIIRAMDEVTEDGGFGFRIYMRLRPMEAKDPTVRIELNA